jgi:small subunit ribosomal protein S17
MAEETVLEQSAIEESEVSKSSEKNTPAGARPEGQKFRVQKTGKVVSTKMDKTIVVEVLTMKRHPLYRKQMRRTIRFKAHDETNSCKMNDIVRIEECRPISKEKHFRLVEIVQRGVQL